MEKDIRGFTIIELIVVMAIFAILAAIAAPNISQWMSSSEYRNTSQQFLQVLQKARARAITENRQFRVDFDLAGDDAYSYKLSRGDRPAKSTVFTDLETWQDSAIPNSVALRGTLACTGTADITFTFNPNGTAGTPNYICIFDRNNMAAQRYRVGVTSSNTGRIVLE